MLSYSRFLLLLTLLPLAACGFQPAYGTRGAVPELFGRVQIQAPTDKNAFDLVERLENRLGRPQAPNLNLRYSIDTQEFGLAITPENAITRYNVTGNIRFSLADQAGDVLADGLVTSFTSYSASGTTVSTTAARQDAYERLMSLLADQMVTRLIAARAGSAP